jgi:hypothetical protein
VTHVTESVITFFGSSLMRNPNILNHVRERSAQESEGLHGTLSCLLQPSSGRLHIARIRWVNNQFSGTLSSTFVEVLRAYRSHTVRCPATKREFVVPHTNISRGFVTMESGSWDLFYFLGQSLPGMNPGHGRGNVTALKDPGARRRDRGRRALPHADGHPAEPAEGGAAVQLFRPLWGRDRCATATTRRR